MTARAMQFFYGFCCFTSPERKTLLPGVVLVDCPEALKLEKMRTSELCYSCFKEKDFLKLSFRTEPELSTVGKLVRHTEEQRTVGKMAHRGKDGAPRECTGQSRRWVCFSEERV